MSDLPLPTNPWVRLSGVYRDHPLFDELLAEMEADRRELDAEDSEPDEPSQGHVSEGE